MNHGPTLDEERALAVGEQVADWKRSGILSPGEAATVDRALETRWKTSGTIARIAFFTFGILGVSSLFGLLALVEMPLKGLVTAVIACAIAEVLVRKQNVYHGGIEEGLFLSGLCAFIAGLPSEGKLEALLAFAAAFAIAGARMRNAIVTVCAPLLVVAYIALKSESTAGAGVICLAVGVIASLAQLRRLRSPFVDRVLGVTLVVLPVIGWALVYLSRQDFFSRRDGIRFSTAAALFGIVAIGELLLGLRARSHPHLVAALLLAAAVAFDVSDQIVLSADAKLIGGGALLFAVSLLFDRWLRAGSRVTSQKLVDQELARAGELVAGAMLAASTQSALPAASPSRTSGGGEFGGGGASGEYYASGEY